MDDSRVSRSSSQRSREGRVPLDSTQLWTILLYKETRKLLGASAHAFRSVCPVEGVQSPPDGKTGNNNHLTVELLRQSEAIGYDTRVFPQWSWRDTDRIHRWLQGARTDELMSFSTLSCEECSPIVSSLRRVRDEHFHSWVVACKIDTAWIPTLIPFDASCPGTHFLRASIEKIYSYLTPSGGLSPSGSSFNSGHNNYLNIPPSTSKTNSGATNSECDTHVLSYFLHQYIPFLFPGISEDKTELAITALLEVTALWQTSPTRPRNMRTLASSIRSGQSTNSEGSSASSSRTHLEPHMVSAIGKGDAPPNHAFPIVAAILVVLAEPYCFNERDAANFFTQGGSMLLKSIGPSLKAEVDRLKTSQSSSGVHPSISQFSPNLPNLLALSEATYGSSASLVSDLSHSREGQKGAAVRMRVRVSSWSNKVPGSELPRYDDRVEAHTRLPEIPSRQINGAPVVHPLVSQQRRGEVDVTCGSSSLLQPRCPSVTGRRVSVTFVSGGGTGINYSLSAQGASASIGSNSNSFRVPGIAGSPHGASVVRSTGVERDQEGYSGWFSEVGKHTEDHQK